MVSFSTASPIWQMAAATFAVFKTEILKEWSGLLLVFDNVVVFPLISTRCSLEMAFRIGLTDFPHMSCHVAAGYFDMTVVHVCIYIDVY